MRRIFLYAKHEETSNSQQKCFQLYDNIHEAAPFVKQMVQVAIVQKLRYSKTCR